MVRSLLSCTEFIARANIFTPFVDYGLAWFKLLSIIDADDERPDSSNRKNIIYLYSLVGNFFRSLMSVSYGMDEGGINAKVRDDL